MINFHRAPCCFAFPVAGRAPGHWGLRVAVARCGRRGHTKASHDIAEGASGRTHFAITARRRRRN